MSFGERTGTWAWGGLPPLSILLGLIITSLGTCHGGWTGHVCSAGPASCAHFAAEFAGRTRGDVTNCCVPHEAHLRASPLDWTRASAVAHAALGPFQKAAVLELPSHGGRAVTAFCPQCPAPDLGMSEGRWEPRSPSSHTHDYTAQGGLLLWVDIDTQCSLWNLKLVPRQWQFLCFAEHTDFRLVAGTAHHSGAGPLLTCTLCFSPWGWSGPSSEAGTSLDFGSR